MCQCSKIIQNQSDFNENLSTEIVRCKKKKSLLNEILCNKKSEFIVKLILLRDCCNFNFAYNLLIFVWIILHLI